MNLSLHISKSQYYLFYEKCIVIYYLNLENVVVLYSVKN